MKWYWWILIVIIAIVIIIGIWYYIEANKNYNQLKLSNMGFNDLNTKQGIIDYTLDTCNNSSSKSVASLISLNGYGKYMTLSKIYNLSIEEQKEFITNLCNCINSKGFSIMDIYYSKDIKLALNNLGCN